MGRSIIEPPVFITSANGFDIKMYRIADVEDVTYVARIIRPTPFKVAATMELEDYNLPFLIFEAIEWTYYYVNGSRKDEDNEGGNRYSKRAFSIFR